MFVFRYGLHLSSLVQITAAYTYTYTYIYTYTYTYIYASLP
jgi:hypothetical protein